MLALCTVADIDGLPVTGPLGDFEAEFFVVLAGLDPLANVLDGAPRPVRLGRRE